MAEFDINAPDAQGALAQVQNSAMSQVASGNADIASIQRDLMNRLSANLAKRYSPEANQQQIDARDRLYAEYEQQMRNPPKMPSAFEMGIRGWLASGPGSANAAKGWTKGQELYDEQQRQEQEAKLKGLEKMANLRNAAIKEDDTMLRTNLGLIKGAMAKPVTPEKLAQLRQSALVAARNEFDPKYTPNMSSDDRSAKINARAQELFLNSVNDLKEQGSVVSSSQIVNAFNQPQAGVPSPIQAQVSQIQTTPQVDVSGPMGVNSKDLETDAGRAKTKAWYDGLRQKMQGLQPDTPQYNNLLQQMADLRKLSKEYGYDPLTGVTSPRVGTADKTALEQSYTPEMISGFNTKAFGPAMPTKPVITKQLSQSEQKGIEKAREDYVKGPEVKGLEEQAAGAKHLISFVNDAIDNPAKTNRLSSLSALLNSYAKATGLPISSETEQQLREYAKLNQTEKAIGLVGQLMQRGVQTDKDFVRIVQAAFDTGMTPDQRRVAMRQYLDGLNKTITKQQFVSDYLAHPYSRGQERNWESQYRNMMTQGMPESVYMPGNKVLPYADAAELFWNSEKGKEYRPKDSDTADELARKHAMTIRALRAYDAKMREKLKTGAE